MLYLNDILGYDYRKVSKFNFNKCCIWILLLFYGEDVDEYLTLTSVVFEFILFA